MSKSSKAFVAGVVVGVIAYYFYWSMQANKTPGKTAGR